MKPVSFNLNPIPASWQHIPLGGGLHFEMPGYELGPYGIVDNSDHILTVLQPPHGGRRAGQRLTPAAKLRHGRYRVKGIRPTGWADGTVRVYFEFEGLVEDPN